MNVIGTGLNGLVGSRIVDLLSSSHSFENLSRQTGVDILDQEAVYAKISQSNAPIVLHLAAKTDVDGCEHDKEKDTKILGYQDTKQQEDEWKKEKTAWAVNVLGTKNIVSACEKTGKRFMYISTDFVFDGVNPPQKGYDEESTPCPINWYGQTKLEGEKVVQKGSIPWTIVRIAYPYRAEFEKKDFARAMIERFKNNQPLAAITDQLLTPTFIDDIAQVLDTLMIQNISGIVHAVGSQFISPYDIAQTIAQEFNFNPSLISQTTRAEFFANRAPRPFHSIMRNVKITKLDIRMKTFEEGLLEVKKQLNQ